MKRVNHFLLLGVLTLSSLVATAQTGPGSSVQVIYDQLDVQYYPTGLLHNRSPFYWFSKDPAYYPSPYRFDGVIPAEKVFLETFSRLYRDMWFSAIDSTRLIKPIDLAANVVAARGTYEVPIAVMHLDFHSVNEYATDSGYLFFDTINDHLLIPPDTLWINRDSNVYVYNSNPDSLARLGFDEHTLFAGGILTPAIYRQGFNIDVEFGLPSNLFIENQTQIPSKVEVDFDDGNGFVTVNWDVARIVTYVYAPGGPIDNYEKTIRVRLHYGLDILESAMHLTVVPGYVEPDITFLTDQLDFTCPTPVGELVPARARVSVRSGNFDREIRKPVLLVEGFESGLRPFADLTYEGAVTGYVTNANGERVFQQLTQLKDLANSLNLQGYDLVYVDFEDGQEHILQAGLTVIQVIQWLNQQLAENESNEQLVVVGASMGGLISRYALSKMEADNCCHNTRLFCAFDSPHNGANIPLGIQHFVKNLHDQLGQVDDIGDIFGAGDLVRPQWRDVLNSIAARQLLIEHIGTDAADDREEFMTVLDGLGHPKQCRLIAAINGSEEGVTNAFAPGNTSKKMVEWDFDPELPHTWLPGVDKLSLIPLPLKFNIAYATAFGEANPSGVVFEYNRLEYSAMLASKIVLISGTAEASMLAAHVMMHIPGLSPIMAPFIETVKITVNPILHTLHLANPPFQNHLSAHAPNGMPNYTEAPGSTQDYPVDVADALGNNTRLAGKFITVHEEDVSFIPAVSALDIPLTKLYTNIAQNRTTFENTGVIPFDTYWANGRGPEEGPSINQIHVQITASNRAWLLDQMQNQYQLKDASGALNYELLGYYNYARPQDINAPYQKLIYSVDVTSSGRLYVNKQGAIGFVGGTQAPSPGSRFTLSTGSACAAPVVRVMSEGLFMIGDTDVNYDGNNQIVENSADVYFRSGSKLIIEAGGVLHITDNSSLVIEEGAELILHPGAIIILEDADSYLELQGKLTLKQNTILSPSGNGYVKFNQDMDDGNVLDHLVFEGSNEIHLAGSSSGHKRLEISRNLFIDTDLDKLDIFQVRAELHKDVHLHVYTSFRSKNAHFTSFDTDMAAGVRVYGQLNCDISNTEFSNCSEGLRATLNVYGNSLTLNDCNFHDNNIGFAAYAKNSEVINCLFKENVTGWYVNNGQSTSKAIGCNMEDNVEYGISYSGQSGAELVIIDNYFSGQYVGVQSSGAGTTLKGACNTFNNHVSSGVETTDSDILFDKVNGGDNTFIDNPVDIIAMNITQLALVKGNNKFSGSVYYIQGTFNPNATTYLVNLGGGQYALDVDDNYMPAVGGGLPISMSLSGNQVTQVNWVPASGLYISNCDASGPGGFGPDGRSLRPPGGLVINEGPYDGFQIDAAVYDAASLIGNGASQDLMALDKLQSIFDFVNGNSRYSGNQAGELPVLDALDRKAMDEAFDFYLLGLANAYRFGLIEPARAETDVEPGPYLQNILDEANYRIDNELEVWEDAEWGEYYFNISKVHAYRSGEHYDLALAHLSLREEWAMGNELAKADYWECICLSERDLILGHIDPAQYNEDVQGCVSLAASGKKNPYSLPTYPNIPFEGDPDKAAEGISASLSPNPGNGSAEIRFSQPAHGLMIRITSETGSTILKKEVSDGTELLPIRLDASPGVYYVEILRGPELQQRIKWVVL